MVVLDFDADDDDDDGALSSSSSSSSSSVVVVASLPSSVIVVVVVVVVVCVIPRLLAVGGAKPKLLKEFLRPRSKSHIISRRCMNADVEKRRR